MDMTNIERWFSKTVKSEYGGSGEIDFDISLEDKTTLQEYLLKYGWNSNFSINDKKTFLEVTPTGAYI